MIQTQQTIEALGKLGLLERLCKYIKDEGLSNYRNLIDSVRKKTYERVQGIGDDFIPDNNLYDAVGAIYPLLNRDQKNDAIRAHLSQFDGLNYLAVNSNHTPYIREPLLLSDIVIARPLYWPGLKDERHLWEGKNNFAYLEKNIMAGDGLFDRTKVKSDFLVAYALMRKDFTSFGDDYVRAVNPKFLDRVMKGIVALRFAKSPEKEIENRRNRLYELLPKATHEKIEHFRKEADWTDADEFK